MHSLLAAVHTLHCAHALPASLQGVPACCSREEKEWQQEQCLRWQNGSSVSTSRLSVAAAAPACWRRGAAEQAAAHVQAPATAAAEGCRYQAMLAPGSCLPRSWARRSACTTCCTTRATRPTGWPSSCPRRGLIGVFNFPLISVWGGLHCAAVVEGSASSSRAAATAAGRPGARQLSLPMPRTCTRALIAPTVSTATSFAGWLPTCRWMQCWAPPRSPAPCA